MIPSSLCTKKARPHHRQTKAKQFSCFPPWFEQGDRATDLLQTCIWMYVRITKQTCEWWQAAEPADSTSSPNHLLKILFSVLVMRADFKDSALSCLDNEGVLSLTTATGVGDISELPVSRQRFGSINVSRCRVQLFLPVLSAVWSDTDSLALWWGKASPPPATGGGKSLGRHKGGDSAMRRSTNFRVHLSGSAMRLAAPLSPLRDTCCRNSDAPKQCGNCMETEC